MYTALTEIFDIEYKTMLAKFNIARADLEL